MSTTTYTEFVNNILKSPHKPYDALTGIKVDGYEGTWKSLREFGVNTPEGVENFYLMEHEQYPDKHYNIILSYQLMLVAEDIEM